MGNKIRSISLFKIKKERVILMTNGERIDIKRKRIAKNKEQIQLLKDKNKQLEEEIDLLAAAEVKQTMNVLNIPIEDMSKVLKELRLKGTDKND